MSLPFLLLFCGLHQKFSYAPDQKPVTKKPRATYICSDFMNSCMINNVVLMM